MMKIRSKILGYTSIVLVIIGLASYKLCSTCFDTPVPGKNELLLRVLTQGLQSGHYAPPKIDDSFSKKVFQLYLQRLDFNKKFLLAEDVAALKKYETQLDNQIAAGSYEFFELSNKIMEKRLDESENYYKEILEKPFDYTTNEQVELDGEKLAYAKSKAELKEEWRKYLKYQTMVRLTDALQTQENPAENSEKKADKSMKELEKEARAKVKDTYDDLYSRLEKVEKTDRLSLYLNAISNAYDPHTEYYPPKDKEDFDIEFSGRLEGIGASLQEKDGQIKVTNIIPGSPSYRQGELKAGDVILKVAQGKEEPVDIVGMRLDNAVRLIRGKKGTEVRLTVRKIDGSTKIIPIIRDVVIFEETYAKSAIVEDKQKIGYIKLPGFYADFERKGGRNSGADVKKEVEKLKKEGVSGIILDLRNNGGGSLSDAVDMAGLFIERGPIVQVKQAQQRPMILEDRDASVQYDGPLVVLVNANSASASEILAAAIQDYKRGVIVGSNTFGKGTVQQFFNMDDALPSDFNNMKPIGSLKLTTQKFYRVNGGSTQLKGVAPDISLPDAYSMLEYGEKEMDFPMPWDEIAPANYKPWTRSKLDIKKLQANSQARTEKNKSFVRMRESAQRLKQQSDNTSRSLNLKKYREEEKKASEESKKYEELEKTLPTLNVKNLKVDLENLGTDTAKVSLNDAYIKGLQKDIYIFEAVNVIKDQL